MKRSVVALLTSGFLVLSAVPASASVLWDGDAAKGTGVFGNINGECAKPGSVSTVKDPAKGTVFRYAKPSGSNRCESRGIKVDGSKYTFRNDQTFYLGWSFKLSDTVNNNAVFQWKSYGHHIQNYPVVLKMIDGKLSLLQRQPDVTRVIWDKPIAANEWHKIVLGLHLSDQTTGGWVELYVDGAQQTFTGGGKRWACRTFDSVNDPKWGVYGAKDTTVENYVGGLKIGTTYADVSG
ncbi:heparin lyase I family protein [Amycolatopsis samaneae]|uniref:Heparin lyase I family protein n=1 Tax=Amycolatopsis samaneae TaxID=664691 RepID=A0ABW5G6E0_9PSEU